MRKIEKFATLVQQELGRSAAAIEYFPVTTNGGARARLTFPSRFQWEPVLEIREGKKDFFLSFFILNRKFMGRFGISTDDICAVTRGICGEWSEDRIRLLTHIRKSLAWLEQQTGNETEIPEERKLDAMTDLLSRLAPEVLMYGYCRSCSQAGNGQQLCSFPDFNGKSGSIELVFTNRHWQLFFEIVGEYPHTSTLQCSYTSETANQIVRHINETLRKLYVPDTLLCNKVLQSCETMLHYSSDNFNA